MSTAPFSERSRTPDAAQHCSVAAAATMEVIADAPGQPDWWYEAFFEKLSPDAGEVVSMNLAAHICG